MTHQVTREDGYTIHTDGTYTITAPTKVPDEVGRLLVELVVNLNGRRDESKRPHLQTERVQGAVDRRE